ncbi:MAG: hypothetical protein U9M98_03635 [Patescibacteria group bacterium]|nr:hypothetical protein [Patescibacteria group bacterium]
MIAGENKYDWEGIWWFQFKYRDHGRNDNNKLKSKFKSELLKELDGVIKKKPLPKNYILITPVELSGKDWTEWYHENILENYTPHIPRIRVWDFSKINSLLDQYTAVKYDFEQLLAGGQLPTAPIGVLGQPRHILTDKNVFFHEKLSFLLKFIKNKGGVVSKKEKKITLHIIKDDRKLAWHFLRNLSKLNKAEWFPRIKENVIRSIVEQDEDGTVKFQLLNYFETCAPEYSDEILPLIVELEKNTKNYNILSSLVKSLGKMQPKDKQNIELLWEIFSRVAEHQHPWVRREVPKAVLTFVDVNIAKVLEILKKVFLYAPPQQDVTQGGPTLALTFQGRDNENWVFEETIKALSELLNNSAYADKAIDLAIEVELMALESEYGNHSDELRIIRDYSYIWLADKSFENLEYNHNRKERIALEIEKALDKLSKSNKKRASQIIEKLLNANYEVFYLISFRTLQKHTLKLNSDTRSDLDIISKELELKEKVERPPIVASSWEEPTSKPTVKELQSECNSELVQRMIDHTSGEVSEPYDLSSAFADLITQDPNRLKELLSEMRGKKIDPHFASGMVKAYIQEKPKDITGISGLLPLLSSEDIWARMELARHFDGICQKPDIQDYEDATLGKIKESLLSLSKDSDPVHDRAIQSNGYRPDDAIIKGINSVRGKATEALVAFYHYFPEDSEIAARLEELAKDTTNAVKATLIYNLKYLIGKDYSLCKRIINNFKDARIAEIDFPLIQFFANLDCKKFIEQQSFIKSLFENEDEKINENLGELIAYKYASCCEIQDLVDEVVGGRKGTQTTQHSLAFVFESQLPSMIKDDKGTKVARYLKELLKPQNSFEVVERASFLFERDEIKPKHFKFLDENGLVAQLIKNTKNVPAQSHLINYFSRCIEVDVEKERCLEILNNQVAEVEPLLSDSLIAKKIANIVEKLMESDLDTVSREYLINIFDKGLERGWDEFYSLYFEYEDFWYGTAENTSNYNNL